MKKIDVSCVVLAGGFGERFGAKKQFTKWRGKPLWKHSADKCREVCNEVIVVGIDVAGGKYRQNSVENGLNEVTKKKVVIVETARPMVTTEQIYEIAKASLHYPSISYAIPSVDTIYYRGKHLERTLSYQLQVPQAFDTKKLKEAFKNTLQKDATSETFIMEDYFGIQPKLLKGGMNLFKVTSPHDLKYLEVFK